MKISTQFEGERERERNCEKQTRAEESLQTDKMTKGKVNVRVREGNMKKDREREKMGRERKRNREGKKAMVVCFLLAF